MLNSHGRQDGHLLLDVELLTLAVNHEDGDVISTFFHLQENLERHVTVNTGYK